MFSLIFSAIMMLVYVILFAVPAVHWWIQFFGIYNVNKKIKSIEKEGIIDVKELNEFVKEITKR